MATKTKTAAKKGNKPNVAKKVNTSLINASLSAINTTIDNGEKWQKLASKLIKKSEKVREQQINMIFDTAETVKGQFIDGADKMKELVGYDAELVEKAKDMAMNNPVSKKVVGIVEDITEKVSENPMVQKAEKATEDIKNMGIAKYNELKGDVLEQASKIIDKGEAIIEDAKTSASSAAKITTPKAKITKKTTAKKAVTKKVTATKAKASKTVAKVAPKKSVAKETTTTKAKATKTVAKAAPKKTAAKKTATKATPKAKATVAKKVTATKASTSSNAKKTVAKVAEVKK